MGEHRTDSPPTAAGEEPSPTSTPPPRWNIDANTPTGTLPPSTRWNQHQPSAVSDNAPPHSISQQNRDTFLHNANNSDTFLTNDTQSTQSTPYPQFSVRHYRNPSAAGLSVKTDLALSSRSSAGAVSQSSRDRDGTSTASNFPTSEYSSALPSNDTLSPTLRKPLSSISMASLASSLSPGSALPSPALAALSDLTPLPSPIVASDASPGPWNRAFRMGASSRPGSSEDTPTKVHSSHTQSMEGPMSPPRKKKGYASLMQSAVEAQAAQQNRAAHGRNRSVSELYLDPLVNPRPRHVTMGSEGMPMTMNHAQPTDHHMHREEYLAAQRGLTQPSRDPTHTLPSPPPSNKSLTESDVDEEEQRRDIEEPGAEYLTVSSQSQSPSNKRKWRVVRPLGQGTFSKVLLATSQRLPPDTLYTEANLDPRRLVAVKIVEHGPAGGADEERIETSLKREVEILKQIDHPSLVHLKGLELREERAMLVLNYCPGGDLFDLASERRDLLTPSLVQRIFAELVGAVRYLHSNLVVHRDIKLENVLVNFPHTTLATITSPQSHPTPLVTLTDLGLSRRIPPPPTSPLLTTRCGSEDYAAPEILLGQPYDGRATDAWAVGVLLFALMEGRLPFDAPPGRPERSRNTHRIARCEWIWCRFGNEDGEWDPQAERGAAGQWEGARVCVEGLLRKVRMGRVALEEVEGMQWVREGIQVPGGLKAADDG